MTARFARAVCFTESIGTGRPEGSLAIDARPRIRSKQRRARDEIALGSEYDTEVVERFQGDVAEAPGERGAGLQGSLNLDTGLRVQSRTIENDAKGISRVGGCGMLATEHFLSRSEGELHLLADSEVCP